MSDFRNMWGQAVPPEGRSSGKKVLAITLDLESDYATGDFTCLEQSGRTIDFLRKKVREFTVFCEGNVLRARHPVIRELREAGGDMQLHCNDHREGPDNPERFGKAFAEYKACFGVSPQGYRAGAFKMRPDLLRKVQASELKWDSSLLPFARGKRYRRPLLLSQDFVEFPASVIGVCGYPFSMSYCSLLGDSLAAVMIRKACENDYLNFTVHLHDLVPTEALGKAILRRRLLYRWNYRFGKRDPLAFFMRLIEHLLSFGFVPVTLNRLYQEIKKNNDEGPSVR